MSSAPSPREESPEELLDSVTTLRRRARAARQAYWFPLVLFGVLTVAAAPLYVESTEPAALRAVQDNPPLTGLGGDFLERSAALGWYWLAALVGGYLLSLAWYRRHGRRSGVQTPTRAYVVAGIAGTLVGLVLPVVLEFLLFNTAAPVSDGTRWLTGPLLGAANRGMLPHLVIALGLAVLAHLERSRRLWLVVGLYTAVLVAVNAWFQVADLQPGDLHRFSFMLAALLPVPVLLIGGGVALAAAKQQHNGYA
ncbi:hypothetical protein GA0070622_0242 [Micromonospora sediminicola]|uniref:Uncharacterized protein n=1 Tax=Micromonospora sediminicola TaxID=946078 RepID=A0A1A9B2E6_9ACTN|nr:MULTISPECIES: hypothetical protein [Micromonospora]PGH44037.1 hypothetical protein COO58_06005 [Micromonospora sp. WMMA1996]SBT63293.1 hypothetical protein GA0070622_0242 [Micromonospora sediminicola]